MNATVSSTDGDKRSSSEKMIHIRELDITSSTQLSYGKDIWDCLGVLTENTQ